MKFNHPKLGRVLFIHVPKCGGSSVVVWLRNNGFNLEKVASMPHPLYEDYKKWWGDFDYKFMVVREPVSRFCSMLRYRQASSRGGVTNENVDAFARDALCKVEARGYREGSQLDSLWKEHIPPQVDYHHNDVEVFKFEDGFKTLGEKLDLNMPIPHVNISSGKATVNNLSDATINRIKQFYREDYKTFGYPM